MNAATILLLEQLNFGGISCHPSSGELAGQTSGRIVGMPIWVAWQYPPKPSIFRERMKPYSTTTNTKRRPW